MMSHRISRSLLLSFAPSLSVLALGCQDAFSSPTVYVPPPVVLTAVSPSLGSTGGGTNLKITGSNLPRTVSLGGITLTGRFDPRDPAGTVLYLSTPAHEAGSVDLVAADARGRVVVLSPAFTYAPATSFDFNGDWSAYVIGDDHDHFGFKIVNNALAGISCTEPSKVTWTLTLSPGLPVNNGEFTYSGRDGGSLSARIVATSQAIGTVKLGLCSATFSAGRN